MKKNGEENWKKKVPVKNVPQITAPSSTKPSTFDNDFANANNNMDNGNNEEFSLRKKSQTDRPGGKVGSLQERLSQLQNAQTSWQNKVGEKDANKFTVAGKMAAPILTTPTGGPTPTPIPRARKESEMNAVNDEMTKRVRKTPKLRRFHGSPPPANDRSYDEVAASEATGEFLLGEVVEVHELDEDLDKFFSTTSNVAASTASTTSNPNENFDLDLDAIEAESDAKLLLKRNVVRPAANRKRRSKNPVKALRNRTDIKQGYQQPGTIRMIDNTETEKKEKNVHSHLAAEAKAALAATEDFSSVQLKKDNKVVPHADFVPYKIGKNSAFA